MKVFFVTDHPFSEKNGAFYSGGGLPSSVWERYLIGENRLFVIGRKSATPNITLSSTSNVSFYLSNYYRKPLDSLLRYSLIKTELASYLENADCAILRLPGMLGLFSLQICKEKNIPYLIEVVGDAFDSYYNYGSVIGRIAAPIYDFLNKKAISTGRYTLYVTQEYLQKRYPSPIGGKSIGITDAVIYPVSEKVLQERLDKIDRLFSNSIKCGQIGNVSVRYKGYHIMLKALAILKKNGIFLNYHIVGGGEPNELLNEARKLGVEEMVVIRGKLSHEEVESFLDEIDIYVHPSFQEGLPRVVVEAISRACPCLTSNVAGTPELLNAKCLHNCGDYKKLAQDLRRMIMNRGEMKETAIENYNHAKEYYYPKLESERRAFFESFFSSVKK